MANDGSVTYVQWHLTGNGYRVTAYDCESQPVQEYDAGDHPLDSQAVAIHCRPVHRSKLMAWAKQTALEMAYSYGLDDRHVSRDFDSEPDREERLAHAAYRAERRAATAYAF